MKGKVLILSLICSFVLFGCDSKKSNDNAEVNVSKQTTERSVKHKSVSLPLTIFENSNYNQNLGRSDLYKKNLLSFELKDFSEESEVEFLNFYANSITRGMTDLKENYKILYLYLDRDIESVKKNMPLESYNLNKGSDLVIGADNLSNVDESILKQFEFITNSYRVGSTLDETGKLLIAIPKKYANDKNLQLKLSKDINDKQEIVYIDIN